MTKRATAEAAAQVCSVAWMTQPVAGFLENGQWAVTLCFRGARSHSGLLRRAVEWATRDALWRVGRNKSFLKMCDEKPRNVAVFLT
jgi:hypothetical protein